MPFKMFDVCQSQGLSGMEPFIGIPASVGGAIYMNAGADGEIKDVVLSVDFIDENNQLIHYQMQSLILDTATPTIWIRLVL